MARSVALALLLACSAIAGCSGGDAGSDDDVEEESEDDRTFAAPPASGRVIPKPRELHNESHRFPDHTGGPPFEGSFEVPADAIRLGFTMTAWADCPVYFGNNAPAVVFTGPYGDEVVLDRFGFFGGQTWSSGCVTPTGQEDLGSFTEVIDARAGAWTYTSRGQFNGDVQIVVTADPKES